MRPKLHGKVLENEPKDIAAIPRVPDGGQRKRHGHDAEIKVGEGKIRIIKND